MRKQFTNKYNAYQNVAGVLRERKLDYKDIPIVNDLSGQFLTLFEKIKIQITKVDMEFKDVTDAKQLAKDQMALLGSAIASAAMVYAEDIDDSELKSLFNFSKSDIKYVRDAEAIEIARNIEEEALRYKEALGGYMVTEEEIADLRELIDRFDQLQVIREKVHSESVVETQRLEGLFEKTDYILNEKLDRLVKKMELTNPEFFRQYFQARRISDL